MKSISSGRPPSEAIRPPGAGAVPKPVTIAPSRLPVATACRPATPAPSTRTLAGGTVPAAGVLIPKKRPGPAGGARIPAWRGGGGGGHDPEEAAGLAGGDQHRRVAGGGGLRGERVHRLGAGRARDRLHREAGDAGLSQRIVGLGRGPRGEVADEDLARVELGDLGARRGGDAEDDVG